MTNELEELVTQRALGRAGIAEQLNLQDRSSQAEPCQLRQLVALARRYDLRIEEGQ
jgi:hypothetical protein